MKQSGVSGSTAFTGPGPWHLQVTAEECSSELFVLCTSVAALVCSTLNKQKATCLSVFHVSRFYTLGSCIISSKSQRDP